MKSSCAFLIAALAGRCMGFPPSLLEKTSNNPELTARVTDLYARLSKRQFEQLETFNATAQRVSVSGEHKFVPPGPTDLRGPCPGLNAFANHGYLPHNGYATIQQFIDATENVVGMGPAQALFLATYGAVMVGDLTAWSIGGPPPKSWVPSAGLLGVGQGISSSHNKYETDGSPTRPDLYQYGNDYELRVQQWQQLSDMHPSGENFDIDILTRFRVKRFNDQIAQNPYYFYAPFGGVLVQPAAYVFAYRMMANHSAKNPVGTFSRNVLMSWFSLSGTSGNYTWTPGHERIPDNWYKRDVKVPYENTYFTADLTEAALRYPQFLSIGGNTGTTSSFTGVNVTALTSGVFNGETLLNNNNFACFGYQFAAGAQPDVLQNLSDNPEALAALNSAIQGVVGNLGDCPQLKAIDYSQFDQFPGSRAPSGSNGASS